MKDLSHSSVLLLAGILVSSAFATVKPLSAPLVLDGRLDEQAWKDAAWEGPFVRMETRTTQKTTAQTEFALLADAKNLYVGIRCFEPEMKKCFPKNRSANMVDVLFAPGGNTFDFYHFIFRYAEDRAVHTSFLSEGGNIQPDRYIPDLTVKSAEMEGGWSLEIAFPLSAFYMTRNRQWSETWLMNVCRQRVANDESGYSTEYSSWAPIFARFREPKRMKPMAGFPRRAPADDVAILDLNATVSARRADGLVGEATMKVLVAEPGEYELSSPNLETTRLVLNAGENRAKAACRFADNGRHYSKLTLTRVKTGEAYSRTYPFRIDFSEVRVRLTTPAYRDNFYPGQRADRVKGTVSSAVKGEVTVTLEGPGFPTRTATLPEGGGPIDFDTKGFRDGEATLTVVADGKTSKTRILKLAPTGHDMSWVENGHIVLNGRQILPRRLYAHGYHGGKAFDEGRFRENLDRLCLTREVRPGGGLVKDEGEAVQDRKPSQAALDYIAKQVEKNREKDFTSWYISDEPECRNISPIYLRHVYEYMKRIDPYHVVLMSTRGGAQFLECADWLETHPYINPHDDGKGNRVYSDPPARIGNYLDAFQAWDRPDKCIGFLPTLFSYRYQSYLNDYPTFDEYVMHTWAAMMHGGKSLNPYAYHDIGDRPGLFEGACYTFSSFAALEDIVLNGTRTWLIKSDTAKCVRYDLPDESMFVLVNPTLKPQTATVKGIGAKYREFRGTRTWSGDTTFKLKPCEVIVATTKRHDEGLMSSAEATARADRLEAERLGRDNQLLMKAEEIVTSGSSPAAGLYKLFDGVRDMQAWISTWHPDTYLDLSFKEAHRFHILRVFGAWDHDPVVAIWKDGDWQELTPVKTQRRKYAIAFDFGKPVRTYKVRISFRRPKKTATPENRVELYEVELGRDGALKSGDRKKAAKVIPPKDAIWLIDEKKAESAPTFWNKPWHGPTNAVSPRAEGGFTLHDTTMNYQVRVTPECRWFTTCLETFVPSRSGYHGWSVSADPPIGYLCGTTTNPQAGLYTIPLPELEKPVNVNIKWYDYNFDLGFAYAALEKEPADYLLCTCADGGTTVTNGTKLVVTLKLRDPADEATACFLLGTSGGMHGFPINGSEAIQMRRADKKGLLWKGEVVVRKHEAFRKKRQLVVRATVLGGALDLPIFTMTPMFEESR